MHDFCFLQVMCKSTFPKGDLISHCPSSLVAIIYANKYKNVYAKSPVSGRILTQTSFIPGSSPASVWKVGKGRPPSLPSNTGVAIETHQWSLGSMGISCSVSNMTTLFL